MKICTICGKVLKEGSVVHLVDDQPFCSKNCAVLRIMDDIITNAKEMAIEQYNECAELATVSYSNKSDKCHYCGKDLAECSTIFADGDKLYCSQECGVLNYTHIEPMNAEIYFSAVAEEISPSEIGLEVLNYEAR